MDELGSRIRHSELPSMSLRSFYYIDRGISYSVLFPNQDLEYGGNVRYFMYDNSTRTLQCQSLILSFEEFVRNFRENLPSLLI